MNKYNIKVGDYVETLDGGIGYVTSISNERFDWLITKSCKSESAMSPGGLTYGCFNEVEKYYARVGENDFTKKKNKFEPISEYDWNGIVTYADKINELISHINKIQERLNEYDSARTN